MSHAPCVTILSWVLTHIIIDVMYHIFLIPNIQKYLCYKNKKASTTILLALDAVLLFFMGESDAPSD
jgi:hypothetical protein